MSNLYIKKITINSLCDAIKIAKKCNVEWSNKNIETSLVSNLSYNWGIFSSNILIGFILAKKYSDFAVLELICISPENQSQGIGSRLFSTFIESLNNIKEIELEVSSNNPKAINLYKKLNFTETGIRKKYYKDNSDAILMKLTI